MIDTAKIKVHAGNGGDGRVSFRREKFIAKGGPDGGDGGDGGSVFIVADHNMATLADFRSRPVFEAPSGVPGGKKNMTGASMDDLFINVPVGTQIYELREDGAEVMIGDLSERGQKLLVACGGIGGKGNNRFKSSTNRTPLQYIPGSKGERKELKLEVKLVADVGLIGMPNAGKSTLINHLTGSNAKVANYPFTTINPNLGVCKLAKDREVILLDIPGIIEGASEGKGLGHEFLKHVERTRILVHLLDPYSPEVFEKIAVEAIESPKERAKVVFDYVFNNYQILQGELSKHGSDLDKKPQLVVINKLDITEIADCFADLAKLFKKKGLEVVGISAATGLGLDALRQKLLSMLDALPEKPVFEIQEPVKTFTIDNLPNRRIVFNKPKEARMTPRGKVVL